MKYSQAIVVACVGGAALVSAIPTPPVGTHAHAHVSKPRKSDKAHGHLGKALSNGAFAEKATGHLNNYNTAVQETLSTRDVAAEPSVADPSVPASQPPTPSTESQGKHVGKKGGRKGSKGKGKMTAEEKKHRKEAGLKVSQEKAKHRGVRKHSKLGGKGKKVAAPVSHTVPETPSTPTEAPVVVRDFDEDIFERDVEDELMARIFGHAPPKANKDAPKADAKAAPKPTKDAAKAPRDFDEDIFERDLEDELIARGFLSNLKTNYRNSKADSTQAKADKAAAKAAERQPVTPVYRREFYDDLDARDFDDELAMRDIAADTAAEPSTPVSAPATPSPEHHVKHVGKKGGKRGSKGKGKFSEEEKKHKKEAGHKMSNQDKAKHRHEGQAKKGGLKAKTTTPPVSPTLPSASGETFPHSQQAPITARDFDEELFERDFDELEARDFEEDIALRDLTDILSTREFEDILSSREFEEEIEMRGLRNAWKAVKTTVGGSRKPRIPAVDPGMSDTTMVQRDFEDDISARDIEDELAARGIRDAWKALKNTLNGKPIASPNMDSAQMVQRDFFDELDTREINELD